MHLLFVSLIYASCFISYICLYCFAGWQYHPTFCRWCFLVKCEQVYRFMPEIAEVLMRSTVSTCPRVGARCYPRYLAITRRSCLEAHMVLDMEYREQERPEHGTGGPIFFFSASFVLSAVPASITTGLGLHQKRLLLHEVIGPRYHGMCHIWSL